MPFLFLTSCQFDLPCVYCHNLAAVQCPKTQSSWQDTAVLWHLRALWDLGVTCSQNSDQILNDLVNKSFEYIFVNELILVILCSENDSCAYHQTQDA